MHLRYPASSRCRPGGRSESCTERTVGGAATRQRYRAQWRPAMRPSPSSIQRLFDMSQVVLIMIRHLIDLLLQRPQADFVMNVLARTMRFVAAPRLKDDSVSR